MVALIDAMSGGVYAGAIVAVVRRKPYVSFAQPWLYSAAALAFAVQRWYFGENLIVTIATAMLVTWAIVAAMRAARGLGTLLVLPLLLTMLVIIAGDFYDPQTQARMRVIPSLLCTIPAIGASMAVVWNAVISRRSKT